MYKLARECKDKYDFYDARDTIFEYGEDNLKLVGEVKYATNLARRNAIIGISNEAKELSSEMIENPEFNMKRIKYLQGDIKELTKENSTNYQATALRIFHGKIGNKDLVAKINQI